MQKARVVTPPPNMPARGSPTAKDADGGRRVTARAPGHVWHVDCTLVPTGFRSGYWTSWWPWAVLPLYPFCLHVVVVLDHFSRKLVGWEVFRQEPSAGDVCALLERTVGKADKAPNCIITDKGSQYREQYRSWCREHGVRPRFGAVGQKGSIAIVERFIKSLKVEALRQVWICSVAGLRAELAAYAVWYNESRPHQSLGGCTPNEVYDGVTPPRPDFRGAHQHSSGRAQREHRATSVSTRQAFPDTTTYGPVSLPSERHRRMMPIRERLEELAQKGERDGPARDRVAGSAM